MARFNSGKGDGDDDDDRQDGRRNEIVRASKHQIIEPRCNVCKSPHRKYIDMLLVAGVPFIELERQFEDQGISRRSMSTHKERHLNVEHAAIRQIIEDQAREQTKNIENTKRNLLTRRAVLQVAMQKAHADIVNGRTTVEPRDLVSMISLMEKMDEKTSAIEKEELTREFTAFQQAVKDIVPQLMWDQVAERFFMIMEGQKKAINTWGMEILEDDPFPNMPLLELEYTKEEEQEDE